MRCRPEPIAAGPLKVGGSTTWTSLEAAVAQAQAAGMVMGDSCHTIQNYKGKAYW